MKKPRGRRLACSVSYPCAQRRWESARFLDKSARISRAFYPEAKHKLQSSCIEAFKRQERSDPRDCCLLVFFGASHMELQKPQSQGWRDALGRRVPWNRCMEPCCDSDEIRDLERHGVPLTASGKPGTQCTCPGGRVVKASQRGSEASCPGSLLFALQAVRCAFGVNDLIESRSHLMKCEMSSARMKFA